MCGKRESRLLYYLLLMISAAGILFLLRTPITAAVDRLKRREAEPDNGSVTFSITQEKATELAKRLISSEYISEPSVAFENGRVSLEARVTVAVLLPSQVQQSYPELGMLVRMLPETEDLGVSFAVSVENGEITLIPESVTIHGYGLPLGLLPKGLRDELGALILSGTGADRLGLRITSVVAENGCLTLSAE